MRTIFLHLILIFLTVSAIRLQAQPKLGPFPQKCHFYGRQIRQPSPGHFEKSLTCGSNARSDSIDMLNYAVTLDLRNFTQQMIAAKCEVRFTPKRDGIAKLPLDLLNLTVDSVVSQTVHLNFNYDGLLLDIFLSNPINIGDTSKLTVYYRGKPAVSPGGFGGFAFEDNIAYNLGIGLGSNPYNFGKSWHPCFDNFVERATYDFNIISNGGRKGFATGTFLGETDLGNGELLRQYRMPQPIPTYLAGSATSNYQAVHQTHTGVYGTHPVLLVGKAPDTTMMKNAFSYLGGSIDALEAWYGPYAWGQVGYVMTPRGAMEHSTLIAYPSYIINNGPDHAMNSLMAHELAHHWWGNITTLECPDDMWIKEGNAEYGAHLFSEFVFGKDFFKDLVKDNHYEVLTKAHLDDNGNFLPLSGIPYEYTYGTHTYNKGASVMHNLRGYLGDSLFARGMRSILEIYGFDAVDAATFRDQLTAITGVDMTAFFNDWIYSPGFSSFELDSVKVTPGGAGQFTANIFVQQKLRKAPIFHTNVPLEITFFDENWQTYTATFMASGEFSEASVSVPFQPVWQILNDNNRLNLARMQDRVVVREAGNIPLFYADLTSPKANAVPDSALVSFIHYWVAPDPIVPNPTNVIMSGTHYWRFGGILPEGFKAKVDLFYKGASVHDLDYELTHGNENNLILVWRPDTATPWAKYPYYRRLPLGSTTDGNGFIRVDTLLPGDYAFANGDLPVATAIEEPAFETEINIFPNPSRDGFTLEGSLPEEKGVRLSLFDAMGRSLKKELIKPVNRRFLHLIETDGLPAGMYWLNIRDEDGKTNRTIKLVIK